MKYKFQEGDRVRVVDHLKQGNDFLVYCNEDMEVWAGYDAVIRERTRNYNGTILGYHIFIEHPQFTGMNKAWIYTEDISFADGNLFATAAELADNMEVYPLTNGKVRLTFTICDLTNPLRVKEV